MFTIPCTVVCASALLCVHACRHAVCVCTKPSVCSLRYGCMLDGWVQERCERKVLEDCFACLACIGHMYQG